jgi:SAM-dependent methyltransferase
MELSAIAKSMTVREWSAFILSAADATPADSPVPRLPDVEIQKVTNGLHGAKSLQGATKLYGLVNQEVRSRVSSNAMSEPKILDFGCGWGRFSRFFPQLTSEGNIFGVDVDDRLIAACKDCLPRMQFATVMPGEPLPFQNQFFDVVFANSVFSHLSEKSHRFYVEELWRCMKAGALFIATTMGLRNLNSMHRNRGDWLAKIIVSLHDAERDLVRGKFVFCPTGRLKDYGVAFVPAGWTRNNWAPLFEVVDFITDYSQDVNVAIRNDAGCS